MKKFELKIKRSPVLNTKFGTASIQRDGYYMITSWDEGNVYKKLHNVIYEDNNCPIPKDHLVYHVDGDITNNCLNNLECISMAKYGALIKDASKQVEPEPPEDNNGQEETKINFKISRKKNRGCTQGFTYVYEYIDTDGKTKKFSRVNFKDLEREAGDRGLPFIKSEYYNVSFRTCRNAVQGYEWFYPFTDQSGKMHSFTSVNIEVLEKKVKDHGLPWGKLEEGIPVGAYDEKNRPKINTQMSNEDTEVDEPKKYIPTRYKVFKHSTPGIKPGFTWVYSYHDEKGKCQFIQHVNYKRLESIVRDKGFPWPKPKNSVDEPKNGEATDNKVPDVPTTLNVSKEEWDKIDNNQKDVIAESCEKITELINNNKNDNPIVINFNISVPKGDN